MEGLIHFVSHVLSENAVVVQDYPATPSVEESVLVLKGRIRRDLMRGMFADLCTRYGDSELLHLAGAVGRCDLAGRQSNQEVG